MEKMFNKTLALVKECSSILKSADFEKEASSKKDGSLVTKYDLLIDKKLTEGLKQIANYPVFSEEHIEEHGNTYFIIDPIDGTHNFNSGLEFFGILVAFVKDGVTQFSIVDLPALNKTFTAIKGKGAYLNGNQKISVRKCESKLVGACDITPDTLKPISDIVNSGKNIDLRSLYCTGLEIAYLAGGLLDFVFVKNSCFEWDFMGPKLILEEAGGILKYEKLPSGRCSVVAGSKEAIGIIENITKII